MRVSGKLEQNHTYRARTLSVTFETAEEEAVFFAALNCQDSACNFLCTAFDDAQKFKQEGLRGLSSTQSDVRSAMLAKLTGHRARLAAECRG